MQKPERNLPLLIPIGCKVLPRGLIFHSALAIYALGFLWSAPIH